MKFLHIADLHIGKRIYEMSMLEQQRGALEQILGLVDTYQPEAVVLAGDIYDKSIPSVEAVELFDDFLTELSRRDCTVFVVGGNHDSRERLSFGSRILRKGKVCIAGGLEERTGPEPLPDEAAEEGGAKQGLLRREVLEDKDGPVYFWLLPYIKPALVRPFFQERELNSYHEAVAAVLEQTEPDTKVRNVLVSHQFVTAGGKEPERSDSEAVSVGGVENVDAGLFEAFDYVALGHIHRPQHVGRETIRYAGSLLKYSLSEANHQKSATLVELEKKGNISLKMLPLTQEKDIRAIKGPLESLVKPEVYALGNREDFLFITLTDEELLPDPMGRLRAVYPNIMQLSFENSRTAREAPELQATVEEVAQKSPLLLFEEFFQAQNGHEMSQGQKELMEKLFEEITEGATK